MYTYIREKYLHRGIMEAMKILNNAPIVSGENQTLEDKLKEIQLVMDIESVNETKILKAMPSDLETLVDYELELVEGTRDADGAFGYTYHGLFNKNIDYVINELKRNSNSRRATLLVADSNSMKLQHPPCLQRIHFTIKEGKLNTTVQMRSNDGVKAIVMNSFAFVQLARYIADSLGIKELGSYTHMADSFHAYSKDWKELNNYCKMFELRKEENCVYNYEEYIEVYNEIADKIREKYKNK